MSLILRDMQAWYKTEKRSLKLINDRFSLQAGLNRLGNKIKQNKAWLLTQNLCGEVPGCE